MKVVIACDHAGLKMKSEINACLAAKGVDVLDLGAYSETPSDYSDYAVTVAEALVEKKADFGILVCTTGAGMSICANRFSGVRAALCTTADAAIPAARWPGSASAAAPPGSRDSGATTTPAPSCSRSQAM